MPVRWTTSSLIASLLLGCCGGLLASAGSLYLYTQRHPRYTDPGNVLYLLWKRGLYPAIAVKDAEVAMTRDQHPESALRGLSAEAIRQRFGTAEPVNAANPAVGSCLAAHPRGISGVPAAGHAILQLNGDAWLAILVDGQGADVIHCESL